MNPHKSVFVCHTCNIAVKYERDIVMKLFLLFIFLKNLDQPWLDINQNRKHGGKEKTLLKMSF